MANPDWVPVISSQGFDGLMNQQSNWAGFNKNVLEGNRAAQFAAWRARQEDALNRERLETDRASRADQIARRENEMLLGNKRYDLDFAENKRRYAIDVDLQKAGQKINAERYQFARTERAAEEKKYLDAIDRTGEHVSKQLLNLGPKLDAARADNTAAQTKLEQIRSGLEKGLSSDIEWRPSAKRFAPRQNKSPDEVNLAKMHKANAELELAQADYSAANNLLGQYETAYLDLQKQAGRDLLLGEEGGKHFVFSSLTNKRFPETPPPSGDFSWGDYDSGKAAALVPPPAPVDRSLTNFLFPGVATNAAAIGPAPVQQAAQAAATNRVIRMVRDSNGQWVPASGGAGGTW